MLFISFFVVLAILSGFASARHVHKASMNSRVDFVKRGIPAPTHEHEIVIHIKQNNLAQLESILNGLSSPGHPDYQKWLTFEEVRIL